MVLVLSLQPVKNDSFHTTETYRIHVRGLVQGVGFRPFVYRLAIEHGLAGTVENRNDGVIIHINCSDEKRIRFIEDIWRKAPPASHIAEVDFQKIPAIGFTGFEIVQSASVSDTITDISPDIAVCSDCLNDMKKQPNRINYPFINCTNCGPRFTIIKDLPYDREKTTMKEFVMCDECRKEYADILDRRFHAQPVACSVCGPEYSLHCEGRITEGSGAILPVLAGLLEGGKIVAVKGLGGFFLACDAGCESAVARLRGMKNREGKPFAVMFRDVATLKEYAAVSEEEEKSLLSLRRPIIILDTLKELAPSVTMGFSTIGAMLPYMPLHYLIFEHTTLPAIVLTSGNISDEPILINNEDAIQQFAGIADAVLTYNREIHNRADDSVAIVVNRKERLIRRSRGYVPSPVQTGKNVEGILATGAELVNCFCIGKGQQAVMSQHIGDLKNIETYEFYRETIEKFSRLYRFNPRLVVCDLHPDYLSSRYAAETGLPLLQVQHHHAHIVSCMAEHRLEGKVIGIAMDGTGLGDDGNIWGSEFMICDEKLYERKYHFDYIPLPGGDKVTHEPWRTAVSCLYGCNLLNNDLPFLKNIPVSSVGLLCNAIDKKINSPLSSGAGRLFDAVAAMINLCTVSTFHAEAPMRLEAILKKGIKEHYPYEIIADSVSFSSMFNEILKDIRSGVANGEISARFHNTVFKVIIHLAEKIRSDSGLNRVVLSGGSFQNRYLLSETEKEFAANGFEVFAPLKVPANDAGIALGQLMIGTAHTGK